jgi:hypothetical protein
VFVTAMVGVPMMAPVAALKFKPAGKVPLVNVQVYGVLPPVALSEVLYAALICPLGKEVVVITSPAAEIVSERLTICERAGLLESVTLKVSGVLPTATVGVPVMAPVEAFNDNPVGKVPLVSVQLYGVVPPVAARVAL